MSSTMSPSIIEVLKSGMESWRYYKVIMGQEEFTKFMKSGIHHMTSSPHYPQSDGQAERMMQTIKRLSKRTAVPFLALLSH